MAPANHRSGACGRPELAAEARGAAPPAGDAAASPAAASAEERRARCRSSDGVPGASSTRTRDQAAGAAPPAPQLSQTTSAARRLALPAPRTGGRGREPHVRRHVGVVLRAPHRARAHVVPGARQVEPALPECAAASGRGSREGRQAGARLAQRLLQRQLGPARRAARAPCESVTTASTHAALTTTAHRSSSSAASSVLHSASSSRSMASRSAAISRLPCARRGSGDGTARSTTAQPLLLSLPRPLEPRRVCALVPLTSARTAAGTACADVSAPLIAPPKMRTS